jgi:hypothetical protein
MKANVDKEASETTHVSEVSETLLQAMEELEAQIDRGKLKRSVLTQDEIKTFFSMNRVRTPSDCQATRNATTILDGQCIRIEPNFSGCVIKGVLHLDFG